MVPITALLAEDLLGQPRERRLPIEGAQAIQRVRVIAQQQTDEIERQHTYFAYQRELHVRPFARDTIECLEEEMDTLVWGDPADE